LGVLANLSDVAKGDENLTSDQLVKPIMLDLKSFYRKNSASVGMGKKFLEFKKRKIFEVEIHEIISRIGLNVTSYPESAALLIDSYFYEDIVDFLSNISKMKNNGKDYIKELCELKKKRNPEELKKMVVSIVENSCQILSNVLNLSDEEESNAEEGQEKSTIMSDLFEQLFAYGIEDQGSVSKLLKECRDVLTKNGCNVTKLDEKIAAFEDMFAAEVENVI